MSKILTDELIEQTLTDQGWLDVNEADQDWQKKMVLGYYEVEFTDRFNNNCQYYIYTETTRDGYEVWVALKTWAMYVYQRTYTIMTVIFMLH